jgi:hypothetical protein
MAKKSDMWRDFAAQAQLIADLRTDLKSSDARCVQLLRACKGFEDEHEKLVAIYNKQDVVFANLLNDYKELIEWVRARAAQDRARAEAIDARLETQAAEDAAQVEPAA